MKEGTDIDALFDQGGTRRKWTQLIIFMPLLCVVVQLRNRFRRIDQG